MGKKVFVIVLGVVLVVRLYQFMGKASVPKLSESDIESALSDTIQQEKDSLEGIFQGEREHEPIACSITDIVQDNETAVITYKFSANYNYASCDVIYHCNLIYIEASEKWKQGNSEKEVNWDYHDLEGVWQEIDWYPGMAEQPSSITVEKIANGYQFTATGYWPKNLRGMQVEIKMSDLGDDISVTDDGRAAILRQDMYWLSPEEGITEMEKIE